MKSTNFDDVCTVTNSQDYLLSTFKPTLETRCFTPADTWR